MSEIDDEGEGPEGDDDFPVLYSQEAMVGVSFYDFSLVFFQQSFKGSLPVANVALPPAAAKRLCQVLGEYVEAYEEEYGEIRMPPDSEDEDDGADGDDEE